MTRPALLSWLGNTSARVPDQLAIPVVDSSLLRVMVVCNDATSSVSRWTCS